VSETLQQTIDLLSSYSTDNNWIKIKIDQFINEAMSLDRPIVEELAEELIELIEGEIEEKEEIKDDRELAKVEYSTSSDDIPPKFHWSRKKQYVKEKLFSDLGIESVLDDDINFVSEPGESSFDGISFIEQFINEDPYDIEDPLERKGRKNPPIDLSKYPDLMMENGIVGIGVDVARYGEDKSCIIVRQGIHVVDVQVYAKVDTMQTTGYVVAAIKQWKPSYVNIDNTGGLGAGVYDRLLELRMDSICDIYGHEVHSRPKRNDLKASDLRTEMAMRLMERFRKGEITLPVDKDLADDIAYQQYENLSTGLFRLVGKDKIKKTLRRSPDRFDALAMCFYEPPSFDII
jgi:hypothetical protein